ncbi:hypothetical protein LZ31DRAFT_571412 [Colletotrichum somersetense]|nr:hypothetical protein LZ31DRAFT_571412 [Colletotrichum somersetense]
MTVKSCIPPPASQSHFATFDNFTPDASASFDHEFARLASSQEWLPGSQQYTRERTIAMHLCHEVGLPLGDSIDECKKNLKNTLVNIVDLIDARRTHSAVMVWQDFNAFRNYTLQDEHRINREEAKKGEGLLASLLQNFGLGRRHKRGRGKSNAVIHKVITGRVGRKSQR